ncbi:MAG TPA: nitronate monooxygenase [Sphingopyxis sp.]|uniref:NAD(P)H-dependent flavin oxidoreductase n=1 Tax=Sphingopyxis sp. TaxID=1908224 RepID=UPI002C1A484B|nr:nitronate monooxygenase [Sphingopyxis sp.]HWW57611.1 nitronate monooxygenase [Sphingopyxis sp.]
MTVVPGLRVPVLVAPMFLISGVEMVVEAALSGVLGAFPAPNCRTASDLDRWMAQISARVEDRPWALNMITHATNARLDDELALIAKYRPPVILTALGSPAPVVATARAYGGIVLADVPTVGLAKKALAAGASGLACLATGAGGHTGHLSPFSFLPAVRAFHRGPLTIGGGISDGAGVAAAIAAGADMACMGTRFISCRESMAGDDYKQAVIAATIDDIVLSDRVTGTLASWLRDSLGQAGLLDQGQATPPRDYGAVADAHRRWRDIWSAGQAVGAVTASERLADIVAALHRDFDTARRRLLIGA